MLSGWWSSHGCRLAPVALVLKNFFFTSCKKSWEFLNYIQSERGATAIRLKHLSSFLSCQNYRQFLGKSFIYIAIKKFPLKTWPGKNFKISHHGGGKTFYLASRTLFPTIVRSYRAILTLFLAVMSLQTHNSHNISSRFRRPLDI